MKIRSISAALSIVLAVGIGCGLSGCEKGPEAPAEAGIETETETETEAEEPEVITRPVAEKAAEDFGESALPRPPQETAKTVQWIDMDEYSNGDLMMVTTLQGNVNRQQPSMYVIHDEIIEGPENFNGAAFWFDQLDTLYTGEEAFTKVEYTDPYEMLVANQDKIKGAIIYHERLCDDDMASRTGYQSRYGDMALLNLTLMMCGQYEAVALNYIQYNMLKEDYGLELEILGDTTKFMELEEDGSFCQERGSRQVWSRVYRYALDTFGETVSKEAMGHNAGFQAAAFDYFVANRMFLYNRIFTEDATEEERELELAILAVTEPNTPVLGCWYLQADEGSLVPLLTENYKYVVVSYESFNVSWTSGLPYEELRVEEEALTLDPTKRYVAFTFSEGDNNSYLQYRMPMMFQSPAKGEYPIGWTIAPACWDMNPNIIRYYRQNWSDGDGLASPEAGVDYVYHTPPQGSRDTFFAISDAYFARMGDVGMRVLNSDVVDPLPYAEKMEHLNALFCGYLETGNDNYSNDLSHFLFRDTPVFLNYNGREAAGLIQADGGEPGFYSISLYGWSQDPSSVSTIMESLGEEYVAVTPNQLADLYRQYYGSQFTDVTMAAFQSGMTRSEMGFLYKATDYGDYDGMAGSRYAAGEDYFIYRFDLAEAVKEAVFHVTVEGDYQIEASSDYLHWTVLDRGRTEEKTVLALDASGVLLPGSPLYLRFGDQTPENSGGLELYSLYLMTDAAATEALEISGTEDAAYLVEEDSQDGTRTYLLPLSEEISGGDLMIAAAQVTAQISGDCENFHELSLHQVGTTWYGQLTDLSGPVYLKLKPEGEIGALRFSPTPKGVTSLSFSPVNNPDTAACLLSLDENEVTENGYGANRQVDGENVMVYRFVTSPDVTEASLRLTTSGPYRLSVSNDGEHYEELYCAQNGEIPPSPNLLDITAYGAGGRPVYVRFEKSVAESNKPARLYKLRLLTDLTSQSLLDRLEQERDADALVKAGSEGELSLLDTARSVNHFLYEESARCLTPSEDAAIVYRLDTNSDSFFQALGVERMEVEKLRIRMLIANAYKVSVSGDGQNWTEIEDSNDANVQSASNQKDLSLPLTEYLEDGVVYVKVSRSDSYVAGQTHDGLLWNLQFYLN